MYEGVENKFSKDCNSCNFPEDSFTNENSDLNHREGNHFILISHQNAYLDNRNTRKNILNNGPGSDVFPYQGTSLLKKSHMENEALILFSL